ncbi:MAG: hypothetical protein ACI9LY_002998, partial [Arenicella sp.]
MKLTSLIFINLMITANAAAQSQAQTSAYSIDPALTATAQALMDEALNSDLAYDIVESLTTEVGPRLGGSQAELRAREWGVKLGEKLNFDRVSIEQFSMPYWTRGEMKISLTSP